MPRERPVFRPGFFNLALDDRAAVPLEDLAPARSRQRAQTQETPAGDAVEQSIEGYDIGYTVDEAVLPTESGGQPAIFGDVEDDLVTNTVHLTHLHPT
jgi:hypothetical protein